MSAWTRDAADALAVLVSPVAAYRRLAPRRPLFVPWLLVALPSMICSLLVVSLAQRASVHLLQGVEDPALVHAVSRQLESTKLLAVVSAAPALLLRWLAIAALLWAVATFVLKDAPLRTLLSIVACAGLPDVLGKGVDLAVTWMEGPEFSPDLVPQLTSATSLAAVLPVAWGPWSSALLDRLTPFAFWSVALWTVGVREMTGARLRAALLVTAPVWLFWIAGGAALAVLTGSVAGLTPPFSK